MFDYMWSSEPYHIKSWGGPNKRRALLVWSEHCVECSSPDCYKTCPLYESREDGECIRLSGGIIPLHTSHTPPGAILQFRKWSKIEAQFSAKLHEDIEVANEEKKIHQFTDFMHKIAVHIPIGQKKWIITRGAYSIRMKKVKRFNTAADDNPEVQLEIRARADRNIALLLEIRTTDQLLFRHRITLTKDYETKFIDIPRIDNLNSALISIAPENSEQECTVHVEYLEITERILKKVKCVIWDLDNTLWDGILSENGEIHLREDMLDMVRVLDQRGIVNSICSKNDEQDVFEKLEALKIKDLFVFIKANWGSKSGNIIKTIKQMNIAADTVVFVDDSKFEREEVSSVIEGITTVDPSDMSAMVKCDRFEVPITQDSMGRRQTYHMMEEQNREFEEFGGGIDDFLKTCEMTLLMRKPNASELTRCYELMQRTNQLNISGRRLDENEIRELWKKELTYALFCEDRFGDYGQVGFMIIRNGDTITDFVLSCRVANKKIEHAAVTAIYNYLGKANMRIEYVPTKKNTPMMKMMQELNMKAEKSVENPHTYFYGGLPEGDWSDYVKVTIK